MSHEVDELVIIPARYKSSRLPGKPLVDLAGKPMIIRTAERCFEVMDRDQVIVATDDDRIAQACREYNVRYEMTGDHPTGGDRVAEVAARLPAKTYINVQGDEPVFNPEDLRIILEAARADRSKTYIGYCEMTEEQWHDSKYIKLLFGLNNQLIYIGRAPVPGSHDGAYRFAYRQVCVYAYPPEDLQAFAAPGERTPLESVEDNEVMRFLELGLPVEVLKMSDDSMPVDRPDDIPKVTARLHELGLT
ncbi:3-deoxy-manno-octulosonate cytidylyltransferase [Nesterenkonia alba]|uniref:3-deoxy-manno-octulosonate cytidylyltransferase n=1 Tax=Nesterenkonia alba TaxID=515814 RepID=UPI0003B597C0|nr:3-deoxy-manno-octulosonate cytidylyltransferase [Nesterenkonia alba]